MRRDPRHVYRALQSKTRQPQTDLERSLFVLLHGGPALTALTPHRPWAAGTLLDPSMKYPYEVFKNDATRGVIEAFLIASEEDNVVGTALDMPAEEVNAYRQLFFDTTTFVTDLDLMVYMQNIPEDSPVKPLYKIAFHQGIGALRWQFCRNKGEIQPADVVRTVMTDSYFRSLEHRGQPITSKAAKEAGRMASTALVAARVLLQDHETGNDDIESLRMKFEEIKKNRTVEDFSNAGEELLH
jgi:hypothetical protein